MQEAGLSLILQQPGMSALLSKCTCRLLVPCSLGWKAINSNSCLHSTVTCRCGPCRAIAPMIDQMSTKSSQASIITLINYES